ncbi:hypothetical protein [[Mycobacterium] burgundiense]|uniref:WXG100 family type VII secretion target n=1 Tax=[Mycobacterium] burgundiense TaxID=3064286 RepID=A0ABM9L874_9MYCO|nr:hypothetical protein [Mycolicibacterium sp. MU0053]CAJ1494499.1 hypothetical protein MU0053_000063 [Mycolicibacterium sp. MU0053]
MAYEVGGQGTIDVPPEQLRETMNSVVSAIMQSGNLSNDCINLIQDLVGGGAFRGPAAVMAGQTMNEINEAMQKILTHGTALAEHLGDTADFMDNNEGDSAAQIQAVLGSMAR